MTPTSTDAMRAAFEAWMKGHEYGQHWSIERYGDGYNDWEADQAWNCWKTACEWASQRLNAQDDQHPPCA